MKELDITNYVKSNDNVVIRHALKTTSTNQPQHKTRRNDHESLTLWIWDTEI